MTTTFRIFLLFVLIFFLNKFDLNAQCGTACNANITLCQYSPPAGEGCALGYAAWNLNGSAGFIRGFIYNESGIYVGPVNGLQFYFGGGGNYGAGVSLAPGDYTINFIDMLVDPEAVCGSLSFTIPGMMPSQEITATFSEVQLPENRCSTGSIAMTYTLPTPNCLAPITGASLFHDGGVIIGQSTGLTSYLFENVPNTTSYEVKLYSGSTVVKTIGSNVPFLGPCGGGGTGNPEITNATGGCANGSITGLLTPGNCGPTSVSVIDQANGNSINTVSSTSESFSVGNLKRGTYQITYIAESTASIPCPPSDPITVEITGSDYPELTGTVSATYSGLPCGVVNAEVMINGQNSCTTGAVKLINAETYSVPLTESNVYNFESIPSGNYILLVDVLFNDGHHTVTSFSQFELIHPVEEEICNTVDDNCDGNIDEGFELHAWVINADGDNYFLGVDSIVACAAPDGYVLKTAGMMPDDCNDNDSTLQTCQSYVIDADGDNHFVSGSGICLCNQLPGYVLADNPNLVEGDCNDSPTSFGILVYTLTLMGRDSDGDGYYIENDTITTCYPTSGYYPVANMVAGDCDDTDSSIHSCQTFVLDADGDGYFIPGSNLCMCNQLSGYVLMSTPGLTAGDCNDNPSNGGGLVHISTLLAHDADGDGYYPIGDTLTTCFPPAGYYPIGDLNAGDCDDDDPAHHHANLYVLDLDGDHYFNDALSHCGPPEGEGWFIIDSSYIENDCNDDPATNGAIQHAGHPGTHQGIDNNCNGIIGFTEIIGSSADFNNDNIINELDLQILMSSWGMMNNSLLDLNQDGLVNAPDIILFNAQFGLPSQ